MLFAPLAFRLLTLGLLLCVFLSPAPGFAEVYELRTYTTNDGKLDDLNTRFRDHTVRLFKRHGMRSVGYWVPADEPQSKNTLVYILRHKSREAAKKSWKAFLADPDWRAAYKKSEADGRILAKRPESKYMNLTDYSPSSSRDKTSSEAVFELRIYKTNEGKLDNLNARFRDHTVKLFKRHGMKSVSYWTPADEPDSQNTLIYVLRHQSREAAKKSWDSFRNDPQWKKVARESQKDGRFLSSSPQSTYMKATDYSAIR